MLATIPTPDEGSDRAEMLGVTKPSLNFAEETKNNIN